MALAQQIHFENYVFLPTKVIRERKKRGLISCLSAQGSDQCLCLEILPSWKI